MQLTLISRHSWYSKLLPAVCAYPEGSHFSLRDGGQSALRWPLTECCPRCKRCVHVCGVM